MRSRLPERPRALIADGDRSTQRLLSQHLTSDGFSIDTCTDGREAFDRVASSPFDLIVLASALQGVDGIALCRVIRQGTINRNAAIIVVGASSNESETVLTLSNGADDYLTKPVGVREFLARVSSILRRARAAVDRTLQTHIERGEVTLDAARRITIVRGRKVPLSKQEFEVLRALASSPGIVFSRQELLMRHWTRGDHADVRLVDPIISRLRRKIELNPARPRLILTVWGVGYKFSE